MGVLSEKAGHPLMLWMLPLGGMIFAACPLVGEPTGPVITEYSDIYLDENQWRCPLCNEVVRNGDRSEVDPALHLSEWHDVFLDSDFFRDKISEITDAELLASLADADPFVNPDGTLSPEKVKAWFVQREDNGRLYHYDKAANIPFLTMEEFRQQLEQIITQLNNVNPADLDKVVKVKDDLGLGMVTANYTFAAALIQAHSHAIHHFASIGYIISQLGINLPDSDFGYNPTTPRTDFINK